MYRARANYVLRDELVLMLYMAIFLVPSMVGLVVVGRIIARDEMCSVL